MNKEGLIWSSIFLFLGGILLIGFRKVITGNFVLDKFYEYKFVAGISFYVGLLFFIFGLILFLFFYFNDKKRRK